MASIAEDGLMAGGVLVLRALRIQIRLGGNLLDLPRVLNRFSLQLLIRLLLLQLRLNECLVVQGVHCAVGIRSEQVQ